MLEGAPATKFHIPRGRPGLVRRPRLEEELAAGASRRLTLVSAPAGFGKTTAVSAWVHECEFPVAWLSLDEGDNDPSRFWRCFIGALGGVAGGLGDQAESVLTSSQSPSFEPLLTALVNEMDASDREFALVIEDYHVIENGRIHDAMAFLLDRIPHNAHIVIIARADPALPLARLRASGELVEIRADDLRFTGDEAAVYLKQAVGIELSPVDVAALEARTEGWIAGLQMAALSLKDRDDVEGFIRSLSGSHRFILDYLAEEVLHTQPADVQSFLKETSILSKLCSTLCDAVTGRADSREMLETLDAGNLFVSPLDDERRWYRYHNLFSDFLRSFLDDDRIPELHSRASDWYAANGFSGDAIRHALAAQDFEGAARLVEESAEAALWQDSQHGTVLGWMDALPADVVGSRPRLSILNAWTRFMTGQWEAVEPILETAQSAIRDIEDDAIRNGLLGEAATIRSGIAYESGEMDRAIEHARDALDLLPEASGGVRAVAALQLGLGRFTGDFAAADEAYVEAERVSCETGNVTIELVAIGCRAQIAVLQGRLRAAAARCEKAREIGTVAGGTMLPPTGLACVQMGQVLFERNDLDAAERVLREGISLCLQQGGMPEHALTGYSILARVLDACGDADEAKEAIRYADELLAELQSRPGDVGAIVAHAMSHRVRLWLSHGDLLSVEHWLSGQRFDRDDCTNPARFIDYLLQARYLIARDCIGEAGAILDAVLIAAEAAGHVGPAIEALVLKARIAQQRRDEAGSVSFAARALSLAEPEGYVQPFIDEGEGMQRLLHLSRAGTYGDYAARLLRQSESRTDAAGESPDALNERETAILRLMAAGLSNSEIADQLFLSVNTVKWHARNIYGKLDAANRSMAVARARDLHLL